MVGIDYEFTEEDVKALKEFGLGRNSIDFGDVTEENARKLLDFIKIILWGNKW